jgi:hypothetical protein
MLSPENIFAALGRAITLTDQAGASVELTQAVTLVGDIQQAIGNNYNKPNELAAANVRHATGLHCPIDSEVDRMPYSRDEMVAKAREWCWSHHKNDGTSPDHYHTSLGLLVDFITDHFPK